MIFDLELAKRHMRIDGGDDDAYITALCLASEAQFNNTTGRILFAAGADLSAEPLNAVSLDAAIELGGFVLVAWMYENREGGETPMPTRLLWDAYRWLGV